MQYNLDNTKKLQAFVTHVDPLIDIELVDLVGWNECDVAHAIVHM